MISVDRLAAIRAENPDHLAQFGWLSTPLLRGGALVIGPLVGLYAAWGALRCGQHWNNSEPGSPNEPWGDVILGCLGALLFGPLIDVGNWLARACSR